MTFCAHWGTSDPQTGSTKHDHDARLLGDQSLNSQGQKAPPRLRRSIAKMLSGNVVFAVGQWGLVVAIAKLAGAQALGVYALANAIVSPIFAFAGLGLRPSLATDVAHRHSIATYIRLFAVSSVVAVLASMIGTALFGLKGVILACVAGMCIVRFAENGSQLAYGLYQRREQIDRVGRSLGYRGLLGFAFPVLCLWRLPEHIALAIVGLAVAWLVVFLVHDVRKARPLVEYGAPEGAAEMSGSGVEKLRGLFIEVLPLGALALVTNLILNVPRYAVETYVGTVELGYFAGILQLALAGTIIVNSVGQTIVPRLAKFFAVDTVAYVQLLAKAIAIALAIGLAGVLVAMWLGESLLRIVYAEEFAVHEPTLITAMAWSAALYVAGTLGCGMSAMRSFRAQFVISCVSLAVIALASWQLIPVFGIVGGAWALLLATLVRIVCQAIFIGVRLHQVRRDRRQNAAG